MVLVIDTSSPWSALARIGDGCEPAADVRLGGRERDLPQRVGALVDVRRLEAVATALGPGSFTGLRVGVSYGLGLAMGLGIPLLGLGSLQLQAARAQVPATALVEAGRGRVHWLAPNGQTGSGEPAEVPREVPVIGWLRPATAEALAAAGARLLGEEEALGFADAAARVIGQSESLSYNTVTLKYLSSVGATGE